MAAATPTMAGPISDLVTPVYLNTQNSRAKLETPPPDGQPYPLNEGPDMPFNVSDETNAKIVRVNDVIQYLAVNDPTHLRYIPAHGNTFCNIYACDVTYLMGYLTKKYYVPRCWWTPAAITEITNGHPQTPAYEDTVTELTANALYDWFKAYGGNFGWVEQDDLTQLQEAVNGTGDIGVIVGKKAGGHGHITVVVPEQSCPQPELFHAVRDGDGNVTNPLQTQAGAKNFEYGNSTIGGKPWFTQGHVSAFYVVNKIGV